MSQVIFKKPKVVSGEQGEMAKAGVDDYLAKAGTWQGPLRELTKHLPAPPKSSRRGAGEPAPPPERPGSGANYRLRR